MAQQGHSEDPFREATAGAGATYLYIISGGPYSVMVGVFASYAGDPGSIPACGKSYNYTLASIRG